MNSTVRTLSLFSLIVFIRGNALAARPADNLLGDSIVWIADDFVTEVYYNGKPIDLSKRHLDAEVFGATVETLKLPLRDGDWVVFHLANNQLRWNGSKCFMAAILRNGKPTLKSESDPRWSACDTLKSAAEFIAVKDDKVGEEVRELKENEVWGTAAGLWSEKFEREVSPKAIWGRTASPWIKLKVARSLNSPALSKWHSIDDLAAWDSVRGTAEKLRSGFRLTGDSLVTLHQPPRYPFELSFDLTVEAGMRPRLSFCNGDIEFGNEGYEQRLNYHGAARVDAERKGIPYKHDETLHCVGEVRADGASLRVNGELIEGSWPTAQSSGLKLSGGDGWSPGAVRFEHLQIREIVEGVDETTVPPKSITAEPPMPVTTRPSGTSSAKGIFEP